MKKQHKDFQLLLTGTPPGAGNVGEIILRDVVLHYGAGEFECIAVVPPGYAWSQTPDLNSMDVRIIRSQHLHGKRWGAGALGALGSFLHYLLGFRREVRRVVQAILDQARTVRVERVFAVLNNPLMFAVAHRVASALDKPLSTLVWDPPVYLLRQSRFDRFSRHFLLKDFRKSLALSHSVSVVSETMQQDYAAWTKAPIRILRHGLVLDPADDDAGSRALPAGEWVIGFAGSMYSDDAWSAFIDAFDLADWRVAGRPVRVIVMTSEIKLRSRKPGHIDFLGFRPPDEVQRILSGCHLTYMPQPFASHLDELCRYSFPTKLTNYLAAGRPVFVHAPPTGSLSAFVRRNSIGPLASSLDPREILQALEIFFASDIAYAQACLQVRETAREHFDVSVFHRSVDLALGRLPDSPQFAATPGTVNAVA